MLLRHEIKQSARNKLKGRVWTVFVALLVAAIIGEAGAIVLGIGVIITMPAMIVGAVMYCLCVWREEEVLFGKIFSGFDNLGRNIGGILLMGIFTWLWSLLLVIPGIIKALSYSMTPYIMADTNCTAREAIKKSMAITKGHKGKIFVMALSFFWWYLLCTITFGLAYIYVGPYMAVSYAGLYDELKKEAIENGRVVL